MRPAVRFVLKWFIILALSGGVAFLLFASTSRFSNTKEDSAVSSEEPPLRRVRVLELVPQPIVETVILPGTVEASDDIDLAAGIAGTVEWVRVKEGESVDANQPLFRIDQRSRQARVDDAKAAYELAAKNLKRIRGLYEGKGIVSPQDFDDAQTQLKRAEATLQLAKTELSLSVVTAPVSGFVDRIDVDRGEFAHEGQILAHLVHIDPVKVVVGTPERDVSAVAQQRKASVSIDALGDATFPGRIQHVAYAANPRTNTFETTILINNPNHVIRPGMVGRVRIVTARYEKAILVPLFSILQTLNGPIVFVEKDGIVHSAPVKLGGLKKDKVIVTQGLRAGDRVVVVGQRDVADGQAVEVVSPSDPGLVISHK